MHDKKPVSSKKSLSDKKFLLIREISQGFWHEMHHVLAQLLFAEILQRIPVVFWGEGSLYSSSGGSNTFEQFFEPVSGFTARDLAREEFSFYPERWNSGNILLSGRPDGDCPPGPEEPDREPEESGHVLGRSENVIVRDSYVDVEKIMPLVPADHPCFGLDRRALFRFLIRNYIRLRRDVQSLIDAFYDANMKGSPFLAVHVRSSDKIVEVRHLHELNARYPGEIDKVLEANPGMRIFLMTDCIEILEEYRKRYGDLLVYTECRRVPGNGKGVHFYEYRDNRQKGLEVLVDTWLAARCDYFIGNGYSNVSEAVSELKDWKEDRIRLLY